MKPVMVLFNNLHARYKEKIRYIYLYVFKKLKVALKELIGVG